MTGRAYPLRRMVMGVLMATVAGGVSAQTVPECEHEAEVKERFLPVSLLTGTPAPPDDALRMDPVQRRYPFVATVEGGGAPRMQETTLEGPVEYRTAYGPTVQAYRRTVPDAREVVAITFEGEAMGRVEDSRIGAMREAKFPIGRWKQGETRTFTVTYYTPRGTFENRTSITIEKLSCRYEGTAGAVQFRWKVEDGRRGDYRYVFAPGRGLVMVHVFKRAGS
ncbi:hypothetical protein Tther_02523 [Tepidimonas thermarum]|uniref:Uncharacterized protein n=1 Tax=Tepidimonas thermarum TaxID=335431 RepID=A0A554WVP7_9BURK|nr:hypothetical protein [Tepidimonas thermarum]TSE27651.1 hypothetical protein Tther_02523 [Tepidimonas thermarum]